VEPACGDAVSDEGGLDGPTKPLGLTRRLRGDHDVHEHILLLPSPP
jgi:hypothetical protein